MAVMKILKLFLTSVYLVATCRGQCRDIDTAACQAMATQNVNLCKDPALSKTACPKFCKQCPLVCYHCDSPVRSYTDCNTTRTCQIGEQCLLHQLISSKDGHQEFQMNCANLDMCDGQGLTVLGGRSINARNVITQCCADDLCNSPGYQNTGPTTTVAPTSFKGCDRDIEILIQDSRHTVVPSVLQFLKDLVSHIEIGPQHNQVGVATFNHDVENQIHLRVDTEKAELLSAINLLQFEGHRNDIDKGDVMEFLQRHLGARSAHDRSGYKDVIILMTDHPSDRRRFLIEPTNPILDKNTISSISKDVIVINVGTQAGHSVFSPLATDAHHIIDVTDYATLSNTLTRVLSLLCA